MNPVDLSATLDQSTMNLSLNMSNVGRKTGTTENGIPLPVMLQPTTSPTVGHSFWIKLF